MTASPQVLGPHTTADSRLVSDCSESELVARIQQRLAPPPDWLLVGIGDDAAVVEPARNRVDVLTVDEVAQGPGRGAHRVSLSRNARFSRGQTLAAESVGIDSQR